MNDLEIIKKLSNNNNLGIPYLYYCSNYDNNKNIIKDFNHISKNYYNLDDKIYDKILNSNIYKINNSKINNKNKTKNNKNKNKKTKKI